jgi:phospholipase/carboxylesterase
MLDYILKVPSGAGDEAELPLLFVLHGRGADANDLADLAPEIDEGYRFVFPNAPKRFEPTPDMSFGYTWFDGLPPDRNSIVASRELLLQLIDHIVARYPTPPGKIILSGFSQGGMMSLDSGYRTRQKLAGIVVMSGALFEGDLPPVANEPPVLIVHGTADEMINVNLARRARRVLEDKGADVEYHEFPMGHHISPQSLDVVRGFIRKRLE